MINGQEFRKRDLSTKKFKVHFDIVLLFSYTKLHSTITVPLYFKQFILKINFWLESGKQLV